MLQIPELRQEQPAADPAEAARFVALGQLLATTAPLPDLRDLAPRCASFSPSPPTMSVAAAPTSGCTAPPTPTAWPSSSTATSSP